MNTSDYSLTFYVGERRGTVVAVLTVNETGVKYRGIAHCNPEDSYNQQIGEKIAEARARRQYFKAQANEAWAQYQLAERISAESKKYAESKVRRYVNEEKWLNDYMKKI